MRVWVVSVVWVVGCECGLWVTGGNTHVPEPSISDKLQRGIDKHSMTT
jgi:hypothetical protein